MLIGKEIQRAFLKFFRNLSKLEGKSSSDMRKKLFYSINDKDKDWKTVLHHAALINIGCPKVRLAQRSI